MDTKLQNPIDQELDRLELEIRRLKVEYDIFFSGGTVKPPLDTKGRVETAIKRLYDMRGMSFGQRFRYNSLVARYNVMKELWRRQTQEHETVGKPPTVEALVAARSQPFIMRCVEPRLEPEKINEIYDHLIAAKRECGERIGNLTLESFSNYINSRADQIRRRLASDAVDFVVYIDNGRVKFSARAPED